MIIVLCEELDDEAVPIGFEPDNDDTLAKAKNMATACMEHFPGTPLAVLVRDPSSGLDNRCFQLDNPRIMSSEGVLLLRKRQDLEDEHENMKQRSTPEHIRRLLESEIANLEKTPGLLPRKDRREQHAHARGPIAIVPRTNPKEQP